MTDDRFAAATGKASGVRGDLLDCYARPGRMTSPGRHAPLFDPLPKDVSALGGIVQGLNIHEYMTSAYGITIPEERKSETHIRPLEKMLDRLLALDDRSLTEARPPFNPPFFEDHLLTEYWNPSEACWIRVDAHLAPVYQKAMKLDFEILNVPHNRFVIASDAWVQCRAGRVDPSKYGIFRGDLRGLWFIACSLVKDVAVLNKVETLPWDVWGGMPEPGTQLRGDQITFFDRVAGITREPDASFAELSRLYEGDERLHIPATVYNAPLQRTEVV